MKKLNSKISFLLALVILLVQMSSICVFAGGDEYEITTEEPYNMYIGSNGETVMFSPEQDGWYKFYTTGDYDTYATLYNSNFDEIEYADDTDDGCNFYMKTYLYQGYTYYLEVFAYELEDWGTAKFDLYVEETVGGESISVTKMPDNTTVIKGFETQTMYCDGLEATITLSDGTEVEWSYGEDTPIEGSEVYIFVDNDGYGHYFIEIICDDAYAVVFFDAIEPTEPVILAHYVSGGESVADIYFPEATDAIVAFADYESEGLEAFNSVPVEVVQAGPVSVPLEGFPAVGKDDKVMLWSSLDSITPLCTYYTVK